jgi:hypothetical protein
MLPILIFFLAWQRRLEWANLSFFRHFVIAWDAGLALQEYFSEWSDD